MKRIHCIFLIAGLTIFGACQQSNNDDEGLAAALLLLAVASQDEEKATTTCSTDSGNPTTFSGGSTNAGDFTVLTGVMCYFQFTNNSGSTNNFTFTSTIKSGDADLGTDLAGFQSNPTNGSFWTSTSSPCGDGSGWDSCIASTSSTETQDVNTVANGQVIYFGIWGYQEATFNFSSTQN